MTSRKTRICLNMIVKNETAVLPRLFASVHPFIDHYVITDTGSTDGTPEMILKIMQGYGIPGEVLHVPWQNFGFNRNEALKAAVERVDVHDCEWALIIDADEELFASDPRFPEKLESGVSYTIEKHFGDYRYMVPHLPNIKHTRWEWNGVVHNRLARISGSQRVSSRTDVWIRVHPNQGAKSHHISLKDKALRDARMLEAEVAKDPKDSRSWFYLGQSYLEGGEAERAIRAYETRISLGGWPEEVFYSKFQIAVCTQSLTPGTDQCVAAFLEAFEFRPVRAEPLYQIARHYRLRGKLHLAYLFAKQASQIKKPADGLFVAHGQYRWRIRDELAIAAFSTGRHPEALELLQELLALDELTAPDRQRLEQNLALVQKRLARKP